MPNELEKLKQLIPVSDMITSNATSGGAWTLVTNSGLPYLSKATMAAATGAKAAVISIPIPVPSVDGQHGVKLTSIEVPLRLTGANLAAVPTLTLYRRRMLAVAGASADLIASSITGTKTGLNTTLDANDRLLTFTVTTPALDYSTEDKATYALELGMTVTSVAVVRVYDAIAYFQLPM